MFKFVLLLFSCYILVLLNIYLVYCYFFRLKDGGCVDDNVRQQSVVRFGGEGVWSMSGERDEF